MQYSGGWRPSSPHPSWAYRVRFQRSMRTMELPWSCNLSIQGETCPCIQGKPIHPQWGTESLDFLKIT